MVEESKRHEVDDLLRAIASIREALNIMINASQGDTIRVNTIMPLETILDNEADGSVIGEPEITKRRKRPADAPAESEGSPKVAREGEGMAGGRRRARKTRAKRKKRTTRRKRKGGARKSRTNRKKGTTKKKRGRRGTKRR